MSSEILGPPNEDVATPLATQNKTAAARNAPAGDNSMDVSPLRQFASLTFRPQDVSPHGRVFNVSCLFT